MSDLTITVVEQTLAVSTVAQNLVITTAPLDLSVSVDTVSLAQTPTALTLAVSLSPIALTLESAPVEIALDTTINVISAGLAAEHASLRQLIHFIDDGGPAPGFLSGAFEERLPSGGIFAASYTWWTDSGKTKKIVEKLITRPVVYQTTPIVWNMYAADGLTVLESCTETRTYLGVIRLTKTRVFS